MYPHNYEASLSQCVQSTASMPTNPPVCEKDTSVIEGKMRQIGYLSNTLMSVLMSLESRISPVLRPTPPACANGKDNPAPVMSDMAATLATHVTELERAIGFVDQVVSRVEL